MRASPILSVAAALAVLPAVLSAPHATNDNIARRGINDVPQLVFEGLAKAPSREPDFVDIIEEEMRLASLKGEQMLKEANAATVDLSNEVEVQALLAEAELEKQVMSILPVPHSGVSSKPSPSLNVAGAPGSGWVWKSCSDDTVVEVQDIKVSPDPPQPGKNLTVHAKGIVKSKIETGTYADVSVKLGLIRLLTRRFDVCKTAEDNHAEVQCPLSEGPYEIEQTVQLPREIPPGESPMCDTLVYGADKYVLPSMTLTAKFNVHVTGETQDEKDLLCLDLTIDFMHH